MASQDTISVTLAHLPPLAALKRQWRALETRADGSFFTSWSWIGPWLALAVGKETPGRDVLLLEGRLGSTVIALGIVRQVRRSGLSGDINALYLHQTGDAGLDSVFVEFNGFLVDRAVAVHAREAIFAFLATLQDQWAEFHIAGADPATMSAVNESGLKHRVRTRVCPWIDLTRLEPGLDGYLAALSRNTRQQIRRTLRLAEESGVVVVRTPRLQGEIQRALATLRILHEQTWRARNDTAGAFALPRFARFLSALLESGDGETRAELLEVTAGEAPIGILLNFVHQGHVYAYQSGFDYRNDNRFKPGLLCHALAAAHYREQGAPAYHFMAGEGQYKSSLGTDTEELGWIALRSPHPLSIIDDGFEAVRAWGATQWKKVIRDNAARAKS